MSKQQKLNGSPFSRDREPIESSPFQPTRHFGNPSVNDEHISDDEPRDAILILREKNEEISKLLRKIENMEVTIIQYGRENMRLKTQLQMLDENRPEVGCVYIVKSKDGYKIGKTKTLHARIKQLQTGSPNKIEHIMSLITDDMSGLERELHQVFAGKRSIGEWYELDSNDIYAIRQEYADLIMDLLD